MGHARALLALPAGQQTAAAARVVAQGLSVRETERLVHQFAHPGRRGASAARRAADPDLARLQDELAETLGAKVTIEPKARRPGKLVIALFEPRTARRNPRQAALNARSRPSVCARRRRRFGARSAKTQRRPAGRRCRYDRGFVQPSCFSIVSASDTSYLPGASTFSAFTTPLSTSIEKRWQRMPSPFAARSSSRPSAFV